MDRLTKYLIMFQSKVRLSEDENETSKITLPSMRVIRTWLQLNATWGEKGVFAGLQESI